MSREGEGESRGEGGGESRLEAQTWARLGRALWAVVRAVVKTVDFLLSWMGSH